MIIREDPLFSQTDLRLGFRLLVRQPLLAITAIVALTVGIGLANVGFAATEALLFSQLPFSNGDRFVRLSSVTALERQSVALTAESYPRFLSQAGALAHVGLLTSSREGVAAASAATEDLLTAGITPSSFAHLPAAPLRGRLLGRGDGEAGRAPVALISESYWRRNWAAAESAVGSTITMAGIPHTVVGIMPAAFEFPNAPSVWVPLDEGFRDGRARPDDNARLFGVMAPGVTLDALSAQLASVSPQLQAVSRESAVALDAIAFTDFGPMASTLSAVLLVMVLAVLVVIAANVGNLVLARSLSRSREFALRAALGASRGRLVAQVMTEVLVLGVLAAGLGTASAHVVLQRFNQMDELPFWIDFTSGPMSMALVAGATLLATAIAGAWPALRATRRDLLAGLQGGDNRTSDVRFGRASAVMLVAQIAVSVVMLHGALVVAQGFRQYTVGTLDLPRNVLTMGLDVSSAHAIDVSEAERLAAALPGVIGVGATTALPRHSPATRLVEVDPLPGERAQPARLAPSAAASPGYFAALNTTARLGRVLQPADARDGAPRVAVVNEPFARAWFGQTSPLGRRFRATDDGTPGLWHEIVGVVPDLGLSIGDPTLAAGYYVPLTPRADVVFLAVRVNGAPMTYAEPLRRALRARQPALVNYPAGLLEDVAAEDRAFFAGLSAALLGIGGITLVLALAGVYAMMSLIVSRRTREIGIRVALGASSTRVVGAIAGRAALQVGAGGLIGAVLAALSLNTRDVLVSRLGDGGPWTLPFVIAVLLASGLVATWVPLRRALRVRPQEALKAD